MTTVMSIKTDKKVKERAKRLAKSMGFSLGTLINAYLRQFVKNGTVHFTAEPSDIMTPGMEKELAAIESDINNEKNLSPQFENIDKALEYLKKK